MPFKLSEGVKLYKTSRGRNIAMALFKKSGNDYFRCFRDNDPRFPFGLSFGKLEWTERSTR